MLTIFILKMRYAYENTRDHLKNLDKSYDNNPVITVFMFHMFRLLHVSLLIPDFLHPHMSNIS